MDDGDGVVVGYGDAAFAGMFDSDAEVTHPAGVAEAHRSMIFSCTASGVARSPGARFDGIEAVGAVAGEQAVELAA
ncbi:hypothetical protein ABG82_00135 [Mycobacteroides immunogenum]|uniref:Uncharacterized protein n=1 Tax=Mycobacteroides immunogenum TaxID=83262 RepID=A0A7V8LT23_9MYCO|nr:hypothetical protein [Mycobacteroides immunogenum]AMT69021.1 hypothetical protein ABG82_00135 [Mycobacteroides immunogenum]KIU39874.1 hypothetical protein TL11_14705 [Mycobacteroides immunogenum]KPG10824.1 hypothetical protein AN909_10920 [Mycobacteroides immunogenum]KPG12961.1 hypothetical protein AN910_11615 [Mycobacteroides immunogenum]KPG17680.1 hypothetical protein AN908_00400 [Mycobacteroides immunogenum]